MLRFALRTLGMMGVICCFASHAEAGDPLNLSTFRRASLEYQPGVHLYQSAVQSSLRQNQLIRTEVVYPTLMNGDIVIDTTGRHLFFGLGNGRAMRYAIGVGRSGFAWSGRGTIGRKQEWPDWYPPAEMLMRQPYLPRMTPGGVDNPLGRAALYLLDEHKVDRLYRIHGTNHPESIGKAESSGCIRMMNADIEDLYKRTKIGANVFVFPAH